MSERSEELAQRLIAHKTGELASLMLHLGLRLGLFEAMRGRGAVWLSGAPVVGAGLGTLGFSAERAREMAQAAGFRHFRVLDYEDDPLNSFYELRP